MTEQLRVQWPNSPPGSREWFEVGYDLVEAQLNHDVAAAVATARELERLVVAQPRESGEAAVVIAALQRLVVALHEGPARVAPGEAAPHAAPVELSVPMRARALTADARWAWLVDEPAEYLSLAFAALDAARVSTRPDLLCRAGFAVHRVLEQESEVLDAALLNELEVAARSPTARQFAPWYALNRLWKVAPGMSGEVRRQQLDAVEAQAVAIGDLRTRVHVGFDVVLLHLAAERRMAADAAMAAVVELVDQLGDLRLRAVARELAVDIALDRGELDRAGELLAVAGALIEGRGLVDRSVQQAHQRLRLASQRRDSAASAAEAVNLGELRQAEMQRHRAYPAVRERLLCAEQHRLDDSAKAAAARELVRTRHREFRNLGLLVVAAVLASVAALALRSRRRLARLHEQLQAQIQRADAESQLRRQLEQRMRAAEHTRSLTTIAGGIAHDFNNLMVGVLGNADLLRAGELDPERRAQLDAIVSAGERGARLCGQLQAYAGGQPLGGATLDVGDLLVGMRPMLDVAANGKAKVIVEGTTEPLLVEGEVEQLEQVVLNLLANACEARAHTVQVRARVVVMREQDWRGEVACGHPRPGRFVCIEVVDDGEGMSSEVVQRVFDPFFTTRFPGRGLGLAEVYGVVRRHLGAISVVSEPGRGTRFRIYLPTPGEVQPGRLAAEQPAARQEWADQKLADQKSARQPGSGLPATAAVDAMTVLVVDDEAHIRDFVATMLQRRGHRVVAVADLVGLRATLPDLARAPRLVALVDLSMPGGDGRAAVALLRVSNSPAIVLSSGHAAAHLDDVARELSADGAVAKPYTVTELERALDAALSGSATRHGGSALGASA